MKGVTSACGNRNQLRPTTNGRSKQLRPVCGRSMTPVTHAPLPDTPCTNATDVRNTISAAEYLGAYLGEFRCPEGSLALGLTLTDPERSRRGGGQDGIGGGFAPRGHKAADAYSHRSSAGSHGERQPPGALRTRSAGTHRRQRGPSRPRRRHRPNAAGGTARWPRDVSRTDLRPRSVLPWNTGAGT